jgi:catechol 2,3-dioxygenase-like lactoylglutathione lyase family enzyme
MTQIKGFIKPNRRAGELGIHSLDHFHFVVPDLSVAQHFYGEFGLDIRKRGNVLSINTEGHSHEWGTIGEGPRKKHSHMSFGAFEEDIDKFSQRLQTMGIKRLDPPPGVDSNGIWFHDHDGNLVEIKVAVKSSPDEKSKFAIRVAGPGKRGAPFRSTMGRTYPAVWLMSCCSRGMWLRRSSSTLKCSVCGCQIIRATILHFCTASMEATIT